MPIKVEAFLVDGGYSDWEEEPALITRYAELVGDGCEGKQLIHRLITDDWGPPPTRIRLSGTGPDGEPVDISIPYR